MRSAGSVGLALVYMVLCGCSTAVGSAASNVDEVPPPRLWAPDQISEGDNAELWSRYCVGDAAVTQRVMPNYRNDEVRAAATILSRVAPHSFSNYGDILAHHQTPVPAELAGNVTTEAHEFLGYLCGEFRDRATMVREKLNWVKRLNYLNDEPGAAYDPAGDPWMQMKQADYAPYLALSGAYYSAKKSELATNANGGMIQVGTIATDAPVAPLTVCETKYMFASYVKAGKAFDGLEAFRAGYESFKTASCSLPLDEDFYYDFRGDSNLKPNSPESNGMIWLARTIARQCDPASVYQRVRNGSTMSPEACRTYFKYPFTSRWNGARAGLASWVVVDPTIEGLHSGTVYPRSAANEAYMFGDLGPYVAKNLSGEVVPLLTGWQEHFATPSFGLESLFTTKEQFQQAIQTAVDRHTDWYSSKYDDEMPFKRFDRDQAYSPLVASSYEMSASDGFTTPGVTVQAVDPTQRNFKHWMFVFKVAKAHWYTPSRINADSPPMVDFGRFWFDETSFGNTGLANSEKAWDRLGTPLEGEFDSMLYLHNIHSPNYVPPCTAQLGQPCCQNGEASQCAEGQGACNQNNVCADCRPYYGECTQNQDCCTGYCGDGHCGYPPPPPCSAQIGQPCCQNGELTQCAEGQGTCNYQNVCANCVEWDAECTQDQDCCNGHCEAGKCGNPPPPPCEAVIGQSCCNSGECKTGTCNYNWVCSECKAPASPCTANEECCSGQCDASVCL